MRLTGQSPVTTRENVVNYWNLSVAGSNVIFPDPSHAERMKETGNPKKNTEGLAPA
jgi:hypothetical protein